MRDGPAPTPRQKGGLALIGGGVLLTPVSAWWPDVLSGISMGTSAILLLALGASLVASEDRRPPIWLNVVWYAAIAGMAGLLGYGIGLGDRV